MRRAGNDLISSNFAQGKQTFLIPLIFPDLTIAVNNFKRIEYGGDVWELRVDLLQDVNKENSSAIPSVDYVISQLDFLQEISRLPIIFTIRTSIQGGKFPDEAVEEAWDLMSMAIERGCEYIDVQCTWPSSLIERVVNKKKSSKIIASFHDWTGNLKWQDVWLSKQPILDRFGDILKLSIILPDITECYELALSLRSYSKQASKPVIAVGMGQNGQLSRITSPITFVTHPLIPAPSAPGQISLAQIHQCQHLLGQLPRCSFYIFGDNISHSLSPTIHNTAFAELGLPHHYLIHETPQINDNIRRLMKQSDFGGASVTFPHKLQVQPLLDSISEPAKVLGAVNTIIVENTASGRQLKGDNTDWIGILSCMHRADLRGSGTGIIIGAGGAARAAAFALQNNGYRHVVLINRTRATAERLADDFPSLKIQICQSLIEAPPANVIIGCIPADDLKEEDIPTHIFANGYGLVIEMAYRPPITALMRIAARQNEWNVYSGIDVLKEQAYAQFELWTGRRAPVTVIEEALREKIATSKV